MDEPEYTTLRAMFVAALRHGAMCGELDMEAGDLQEMMLAAWNVMSPPQRVAWFQSERVRTLREDVPEYAEVAGPEDDGTGVPQMRVRARVPLDYTVGPDKRAAVVVAGTTGWVVAGMNTNNKLSVHWDAVVLATEDGLLSCDHVGTVSVDTIEFYGLE